MITNAAPILRWSFCITVGMAPRFHIGCSGYAYREWKNVFYPDKLPQRRWFEYYTENFDTLELNVTFYKFPQLSSLQKWYDNSPAHFYFSLKVPRLITHYKQMKDCESLLTDFYDTVEEGLKDKLGCVLFQFPPKFIYTNERLELIIAHARKGIKNVVEFRDKSWWDKKIMKQLGDHRIIFSGISHPTLPDLQEPVINHETVYYRFHGIPQLFYSEYDKKFLGETADKIRKGKDIKNVFIYFNNTASTAAIRNAKELEVYLKKR